MENPFPRLSWLLEVAHILWLVAPSPSLKLAVVGLGHLESMSLPFLPLSAQSHSRPLHAVGPQSMFVERTLNEGVGLALGSFHITSVGLSCDRAEDLLCVTDCT